MSIKSQIQTRLQRSKRYVFTRDDFSDIAGYDQVGRILRDLTKDGELLRIGYGLYTKARRNSITGQLMPACPAGADAVLLEALDRLKIDYQLDDSTVRYQTGQSNQIPAVTLIQTPKRFKRKLVVGCRQLNGSSVDGLKRP